MSIWMTLSMTSKHLQVVPGRTKDRKNGRKATLSCRKKKAWVLILVNQATNQNQYVPGQINQDIWN